MVSPVAERALVVGLGTSGLAVARLLRDGGSQVVAIDDDPGATVLGRAAELDGEGAQFVARPDGAALERLVTASDVVVPSPGVPVRHPVFAVASALGVPVRGEVELAWRRARVPLVAVTGTNGKTTVTALINDMLVASGLGAIAAGNIGLPLSEAVGRKADVIVAEVSSFQLQFTDSFRPAVAVWLNLAEDHLDWHPDLAAYARAKAGIWAHQESSDVAVANADDPTVVQAAADARGGVVTFGLGRADFSVADGQLRTPDGEALAAVGDLARALPHDLANALAASAGALAAGATVDGVRRALLGWQGFPHRVALVGDAGGVRWYDDSKATNPHATLAAITGFPSVVLIAGGRNKGLDLSVLRSAAERIRAVVAIGEAAPEIAAAFGGLRPVSVAASMDEAVRTASAEARPGDSVLLSPGCASFDWYGSYAERGDHFAEIVGRLLEETADAGRD